MARGSLRRLGFPSPRCCLVVGCCNGSIGTVGGCRWPGQYRVVAYGAIGVIVGLRGLRGLVDMSPQCWYVIGRASGSFRAAGGCG